MLSRLKRLFRTAAPAATEIVRRDPYRFTVQEWRANQELCKQAAKALSDPTVRIMLDCLRNSHLAMFHGQRSTEERAFHHAQCEGYSVCLNTFEALASYEKPKEEIAATFEPMEV